MAYNVGAVVGHIRLDTTGWTRPRDAILRDVRNLGFAFTALGAAISAPVVKAVQEYGKFEQAMRKATSVSIVTEEQFGRMSKAAEQASIRFNIAAEEAAKGYLFLGRAGLTAEQQMLAFGPVTMAAKAMMEDLEQTAEGVVNVMNAFAIGFDQTARITDVLTNVVNGTTLSLNELLVSLSYAGKPAKAFNNTIEDTAAMIGLVANEGIRGSKSGTALRFALTALASPTAEARRIIHQLGIEIYNVDGTMKPFVEIMAQLEEQFKNTGEEFRNVVLESLYGRRALPAMIALFDQGSAKVKAFSEGLKRAGTTEETVNKQMVAMKERWGQMVQGVRMLARHLGQTLAPRIIEITKNVRDQIDVWVEWVDTHQKAVAEIVKSAANIGASLVIWGALAAVLTIVLGVARQLGSVFVRLAAAVVKVTGALVLFSVSNPWFLALVAGMMTMAGLAYIVRARWDDFVAGLGVIRDGVADAFAKMKDVVQTFTDFMVEKAGLIGRAVDKIIPDGFGERFANFFKSAADRIKAWNDNSKLYTTPDFQISGAKNPFALMANLGRGAASTVATEVSRTTAAVKSQAEKDWAWIKTDFIPMATEAALAAGRAGVEVMAKLDSMMKGWLDSQTGGIFGRIFGTRSPWEDWYERMAKTAREMATMDMDKFMVNTPFGKMNINRTFGPKHRLGRLGAIADEVESAWKGALEEVSRSLSTLGEQFQTMQKSMVDGWTTAFDELMQQGSSFGSFMDRIFQSILVAFRQMVAQMAAQELLGRLTGQNMGMWRGGTEGISPLGTFSSLLGIGASAGSRGVSIPYAPSYAPTSNLPDISGSIRSPKVVLSVTNNGAPVALKQVGEQMVGRDMVVSYVMEEMQTNPDFRDMVRGGSNG